MRANDGWGVIAEDGEAALLQLLRRKVAGIPVSLGQQDVDLAFIAQGGLHFRAVQPVDLPVARSGGLHRAQRVGTAARFSQRHHADDFAADQLRYVFVDLRRCPGKINAGRACAGLLIAASREADVWARITAAAR